MLEKLFLFYFSTNMATSRLTQFTQHFEKLLKLFTTYPVYEKYSQLGASMKNLMLYKVVEALGANIPKTVQDVKEEKWENVFSLFGNCVGDHLPYFQKLFEEETTETKKEIQKEVLILLKLLQ